jgi:hypothetical protein
VALLQRNTRLFSGYGGGITEWCSTDFPDAVANELQQRFVSGIVAAWMRDLPN